MGCPCHIARSDLGRGRDALRAIRRGMSKKRATAYLTCPSELVRCEKGREARTEGTEPRRIFSH